MWAIDGAFWAIYGGEKLALFRKILFATAAAGTLQSAMLLVGNQNLGNFLVYGLTGTSWAYGIWYQKVNELCKKGVWKWLRLLVVFGLVIATVLIAVIALTGKASTVQGDESALIVLGAGLKGKKPSGMLARRLDAAYNAWQNNPTLQIVVSGGQGNDEEIPEAQAMAEYLVEKGVPAENILMEDKSTNTWENFSFSAQLLQQEGIDCSQQPVAFATSDFHCLRAKWIAEQMDFFDVRSIPAPTPISRVIPSWLREAVGVVYYMIFRR